MVRPVYTKRLALTTASFGEIADGPPVGFVWDLRDMRALSTRSSPYVGGAGFAVLLDSTEGFPLWHIPNTVGGVTYEWHGRQVVYPGEGLFVDSLDAFTFWITGYELSTP